MWALAFVGFAQQSLWAKLLAPIGLLYERNTLLELTWQHLQLSLSEPPVAVHNELSNTASARGLAQSQIN